MAKFYVQSGTLKMVVHADGADRAALWAAHQALAQVLPVFDDEELSPLEKQAVATFRGTLVLDETIRLSQRGYDRDDALVVQTSDVVTEWSQLVIALQKIEAVVATDEGSEELSLAI